MARGRTTEKAPTTAAPQRSFRAKLFRTGGSQAVRLPKECRLPGTEVAVTVQGSKVILEAIDDRGWTPEFKNEFFRGPPDEDAFPDRPPQGEPEERDYEGE